MTSLKCKKKKKKMVTYVLLELVGIFLFCDERERAFFHCVIITKYGM